MELVEGNVDAMLCDCLELTCVGRRNIELDMQLGVGKPLRVGIEALRQVGSYVRSVHCKDAKWAARPGEEWGTEVPLGEGDVGMEEFLRTLAELGYDGPLTFEGPGDLSDISRRIDRICESK